MTTQISDKDIINVLLKNRSITFGDLFSKNRGLNIKEKFTTFPKIVKNLDKIYFLIDKLNKNGAVEIRKDVAGPTSDAKSFFNGINVVCNDGDEEITAHMMHWMVNYVEKTYNNEITVNNSLLEFIDNGYRTNEEKWWRRNMWLAVIVAILSSFLSWFIPWLYQIISKSGNI